jgi:hypothetical protein
VLARPEKKNLAPEVKTVIYRTSPFTASSARLNAPASFSKIHICIQTQIFKYEILINACDFSMRWASERLQSHEWQPGA